MTDIHRLRSYMTTLVMKEIYVKLDRSKFHRPSRAQVCFRYGEDAQAKEEKIRWIVSSCFEHEDAQGEVSQIDKKSQ